MFFRKGKRAVEASDSDGSSDEEDEKSVVLNNGSLVVSDKDSDESSGSVMAGSRDGDSSGKASSNSGSEEEKDIVVHQSSDVPKGEITGVQVINEEKMEDSPVTVADATRQVDKKENSSGDAEKNLVEVACETLITPVAVKNQGNDSEVKPEGVAGETGKPVELLNFDDFSSATDLEVCMWIYGFFIRKLCL